MGDSITEGSIASVLKSAGESVAEDEVVVQIETDKVTIDVRSPTQGVLNSVLVKVDETVTVGQHIAIIEEGAEGTVSATSTSSSSSSEAAAAPPAPPAAKEEEVSSATSPTVTEHESRAPSIHFPARRTTDGKVISHLSMEDRAKLGLHHQQQQQEETPKQTVHVPMFTNLREIRLGQTTNPITRTTSRGEPFRRGRSRASCSGALQTSTNMATLC